MVTIVLLFLPFSLSILVDLGISIDSVSVTNSVLSDAQIVIILAS